MSDTPAKSSVKRSSQGPFTMWHGLDLPRLARLLALRPKMSWGKAGQIATLPGFAAYNSLMKWAEKLTHGAAVSKVEIHPEPLFVVGHWRSGTTLLHNLLCQDEQFGFPNLYQCLFPHHFLLTESVSTKLTGWMLPDSRPMDNVPCGWDLPQEDEIALLLLSMVSPYRMMAFMENRGRFTRFFDPQDMTDSERETWRATITYLMKKLSVRYRDAGGNPKPLCMKSPSHTLRVGELTRMFPKARFLYIHRDPYTVFSSTRHLRKTMWRENGLSTRHPGDKAFDPIHEYVATIKAYERDKGLVPAGRLHEVEYEDLAADPLGELEKFYAATSLGGFAELRETLEPQMADVKNYKRNRFELTPAEKQHVYEHAGFVFDLYGYDPQGADLGEPAVV